MSVKVVWTVVSRYEVESVEVRREHENTQERRESEQRLVIRTQCLPRQAGGRVYILYISSTYDDRGPGWRR